jgi:hypothetical protein
MIGYGLAKSYGKLLPSAKGWCISTEVIFPFCFVSCDTNFIFQRHPPKTLINSGFQANIYVILHCWVMKIS